MDTAAILTGVLTAILAMGGLATAGVAVVALARTVRKQAEDLAKLLQRKPYWIIEKDEGGIRQISLLQGRIEQLENAPETPMSGPATQEGAAPFVPVDLPPMSGGETDEPIKYGERHAG